MRDHVSHPHKTTSKIYGFVKPIFQFFSHETADLEEGSEIFFFNISKIKIFGNLGLDGRIILKFMLSTQGDRLWIGLIWRGVGTSGQL